MIIRPIDAILASERSYAAIPYCETGTNHQRFSDSINSMGLDGCQNQPWCATYQFAIELETVGKEQALKNWNMTAGNYCGYSVFETEKMFAKVGKVGSVPRVGALVIFRQSHMGRVLSIDGDTFLCGEGNTSNAQFSRDGDACAVKTYKRDNPKIQSFCYIDYPSREMTSKDLISQGKNCYELFHNGHYKYGDSHAPVIPCSDGVTSCDRFIARILFNLGYTDQPRGASNKSCGITVYNLEPYLLKWGFRKITDPQALQPGDIVLMKWAGESKPSYRWHTYLVTAVNGSLVSKYDMGDQWRIDSQQPFTAPINEWGGNRQFYCAFRCSNTCTFSPEDVKSGAVGTSQLLATRILKARDYKGVKKDGEQQELELNNKFTTGDIAALVKYKYDRIINGKNLCTGINADVVNNKVWLDLLGLPLPVELKTVPDECAKGALVLLLQEILRSEGLTGADGLPLGLDQEFGDNTRAALIKYQKKYNLEQTGKATPPVWEHMIYTVH